MFNILVVEDNEKIRKELCVLLKNNAYNAYGINEFDNVVEYVKNNKVDIILLDINLPFDDGFKICTGIREFSDVPIIFVTSRNTDMDELMSITLGGDDFVTKPYNTQVLLARISSILKRVYKKTDSEELVHNDVRIDILTSRVNYLEKCEELTKNELKILVYLFNNKGKIVSRVDIMDYLWESSMFINDNTLTVNINRIRHKLEVLGAIDFIKTKRGQGYII
ncbi:response regulator transcription factor [uncultured Clostridium sp.]|jgi:DNA-binding response OmpR family regulator|uniref:response regulator transcription factor n=1 Tax=uncultured Clostridium sp. TaxID=59620 RepID=UPI00260667D3|nr:response regulator transcription factor [uncultured Clostridium sp.]